MDYAKRRGLIASARNGEHTIVLDVSFRAFP